MTDPKERLQYLRERQRIGAAYIGPKDEDWVLGEAEAALALRRHLRWVMAYVLADLNLDDGSHVPEHDCSYERGLSDCEWHHLWVDAAQACGLLDEWAADDAS